MDRPVAPLLRVQVDDRRQFILRRLDVGRDALAGLVGSAPSVGEPGPTIRWRLRRRAARCNKTDRSIEAALGEINCSPAGV
jgi:hypothetical protein